MGFVILGKPLGGWVHANQFWAKLAMHVTLSRIIELAPQYFASKEKYAKVRLELGREFASYKNCTRNRAAGPLSKG